MIARPILRRLSHGLLRLVALAVYDWRIAIEAIAQGVHSEIPVCCIAYFVTEWLPWQRAYGAGSKQTPHPYEAELRFHGLVVGRTTPPQYLPCPDCLVRRHFVEVHSCGEACEGKRGVSPAVERAAAERGGARL